MGKAHCPRARLIMHLKNDDVLLYSLCSLGSKYKEIVAAIHSRDTSISFEELHNKLLEHEVYLKREASQSEPSHITANATRTYSQPKPSNNRRNEKKSFFPKSGTPTSAKPILSRLIPPPWPMIQFQTTPSKSAQPKSHCLPILRETWSYRTYMLSNTPSNTYAQPHLHSTISSFQLACWLCYLASCHYRLECSVHASRRHRHIVETRLTLLHNASLPLSFWSFPSKQPIILLTAYSLLFLTINLHLKVSLGLLQIILNSEFLAAYVFLG